MIALLVLAPWIAHAGTDMTYCKDFLTPQWAMLGTSSKGPTGGVWTIDKNHPKPIWSDVSTSEENGVYDLKSTRRILMPFGGARDASTTKSHVVWKGDFPTEVVNEFSLSHEPGTVTSRFVLEERNGACVPVRESRSEDNEKPELVWDIDLCHEVAEYLSTHAEAYQCHCGNDATNAALKKTLSKFGVEVDPAPASKQELDGAISMLHGPVAVAYEKLEACKKVPGVQKAISAKALWTTPGAAPDMKSDSSHQTAQ